LFFSASNPGIDFGGMCFERKSKIFEIIPSEYYPSTFLVFPQTTRKEIDQLLKQHNIDFPLIAKPDIGGKGWGVKKIKSWNELLAYQSVCKVEFLIQAWVPLPLELSIFYCRYPYSQKGSITSITFKSFLSLTGNGIDSIEELIRKDDRAFLQLNKLKNELNISFNEVPNVGEMITLVPYGNHARGALFKDYHHYVDEKLIEVINDMSKKIKGFYFGRFDLLTTSFEDLKSGRNISIVELNGCGAEPIHIYDPEFSFFKGQRVIWQHFRMMYEIAAENRKNGFSFIKPADFIRGWRQQRAYKKSAPAGELLAKHNLKETNQSHISVE